MMNMIWSDEPLIFILNFRIIILSISVHRFVHKVVIIVGTKRVAKYVSNTNE